MPPFRPAYAHPAPPRYLMRLAALLALGWLLGTPHAGANPPNHDRELVFWSAFSSGLPKQAMEQFVGEFNRTHQDLGVVRMMTMPYQQMEQKLLAAVAGGVPPDLVLFNRPQVARYAFRGAFEPWNPFLAELGFKSEDFYAHCWREGIWQGRQYSLPFNTDVRVLFYNRKLFRQAGLDPDRPPRTWGELREMSRRLTIRDPEGRIVQTGFVPIGDEVWGNTYFPLYAYQMGDPLIDPATGRMKVDGPKALAAMRFITDFVGDYGHKQLKLLGTGGGLDELNFFLREKMAMTGAEGYMLSLLRRNRPDLDFAVAPLPCPEGHPPATWSGGFSLVLPRGKGISPLGATFIRDMLSRERQLQYAKITDQIPALKVAAEDPYFTQNKHWRVFIEQMQYSHSLPVSPLSLLAFNEFRLAIERSIYREMTPEAALATAQKNLDREWESLTHYDQNPVFAWGTMVHLTAALLALGLVGRLAWSWRKVGRNAGRRAEAFWGYVMALPAIVGLLTLALGPMALSLLLSFCNYDVLNPPRWLGLDNFRVLLTDDPLFLKSLGNTVYFTVVAVPLGTALALALAVLLNRRMWLRPLWRTALFMPSIFPVVAGAFLWFWLFNGEHGLINAGLSALGLPAVPWFTDPLWAKPAIVIMSLWGVGTGMIIFLAALQSVPAHLYESAEIDGATPWRQFVHVTLPLISPTILFMLVINTIAALQIFTQAYVITQGEGRPLDSTLFYVLYLFRHGFHYFHMGYAAAMAWILFVVIGALAWLQFRMGRRMVNYDV